MIIRNTLAAMLLASASAAALAAPVPKDQLLVPPANAEHFVVVSDAGKHGDQWRWTLPDGRIAYRYSQSLRGWITEVDEVDTMGAAGLPQALTIRGITPNGDAAETFAIADGKARWTSSADQGEVEAGDGNYIATGGVNLAGAPLIERLGKAGPGGVALFPSGRASLEWGPSERVTGPAGAKTLRLGFVKGLLPAPQPVWVDDKGRYFAEIGDISIVPAGYEAAAPVLRRAQEKATAAVLKGVAKRFLTDEARAPVLFDHVRIFRDGRFVDDQAVLVTNGKIAAIEAGGRLMTPTGAQVIDGRGKTLVPGLWDSHMHIGDDWSVLANMATGMTSFRSPGTEIDRAVDATARWKSHDLLMGEPFTAQIIDRKDPLAAQGAEIASNLAEVKAAIHRIKDAGMWGVKFYTSLKPEWIKPAAAEAHRLGLHVNGHIPAGMRPLEAVRAGYDEITHINFVMMQAMPQAVVDKANTAQRMEGPAKYAKDVDLDGAPMKAFIAELATRKTVVDPTLVVFEDSFNSDGGVAGPAYAPYMGILSPVLDRQFKAAGYPVVEGYTRDDYRKSYTKLIELVGALHKAGVPIVAGTDGYGMELVRELELYQKAGFTAAEALESATIVPARMVGAADRTGSIAIGKEGDLALVDGDVSTDLGALRRIVTVVSDGYVMDGDALRTAAGFSGRPK